jgi:glycosyltransferase involved in cell wall biosynthesis
MNNPLFSILVANYNNGHFFKDCYESIIDQTYSNWECIIVDDASSDNSVQQIKDIIGADTRFKIYENEENKKCGFTKNKCAQLANGEILGFLDPDDALKKEAIERMVFEHLKDENVSIITSRFDLVDLNMKFLETGKQGASILSGKSYLTDEQGKLTHFASFKKVKYSASVGIDPRMKRAVDQDLYYKLEEQGSHAFIDVPLYLYRIHKESISANENVYKARYWHFYAKLEAYKRRKRLKIAIDNFSTIQVKRIKSSYYMSRFEIAKQEHKKCIQYYFLLKAIIVYPTHNLKYKLKSLL